MATSRKKGRGGKIGASGNIKAAQNVESTNIASTDRAYSEGAIHQKHIKELLDKLEGTRSENGANRIVDSLENVKNTIQKQIDVANFQIKQGKEPSVDLPSLKKAMGDANRAIDKARAKASKSPAVGAGGRPTNFGSYKKASQAPDYIKTQVNVDISKYHSEAAKRFEKRGQYTIDISDMGKDERNRLATALNQKYSPYTGRQSGTWIFTITKKK